MYGGNVLGNMKGNFVQPTLVEIDKSAEVLKEEYFVPICYLIKFDTFEEAV